MVYYRGMGMGFLRKYAPKPAGDVGFLHSSGYAKLQNGGNVGVATKETFAQRQERERSRKLVGRYGASKLGATVGGARPKAHVGGNRPVGGKAKPLLPPKR